jgi:hypothetical protein
MIDESSNRQNQTRTPSGVESLAPLSVSRVVGALQVVLATRRAARAADAAARSRAQSL